MTDLSRRVFIKRAAATGALVWTTPLLVESVSSRAYAGSAKPRTRNPGRVESSQLPTPQIAVKAEPVATSSAQLPFTGDAELREAVVGIAAVVAGAVLLVDTPNPRGET